MTRKVAAGLVPASERVDVRWSPVEARYDQQRDISDLVLMKQTKLPSDVVQRRRHDIMNGNNRCRHVPAGPVCWEVVVSRVPATSVRS